MKILTALIILTCVVALNRVSAQEIILIRHAAVALEHHGWMGAKKAAELNRAYNTAPVYQFNPDTVLAKIPNRITDTVYVSTLPRSIGTGIKLFGDSATLVSLKMLDEFEMQMIWLPLVLPYKGWTSVSRALWILGLEKPHSESHSEAKERAQQVCNFIENKARSQKQIILVTHGFINRYVSTELKSRGWSVIHDEGKKNLGATVLRNNIHPKQTL